MHETYDPRAAARLDDLLGHAWAIPILAALAVAPRRYLALQTLLTDITAKTLTARLKALTRAGLVRRAPLVTVRGGVEYALTPAGYDLAAALAPALHWAANHSLSEVSPQ